MLVDTQADKSMGKKCIEKHKIKHTRFNYKRDKVCEKGTTEKSKEKQKPQNPLKLDGKIPCDFMAEILNHFLVQVMQEYNSKIGNIAHSATSLQPQGLNPWNRKKKNVKTSW